MEFNKKMNNNKKKENSFKDYIVDLSVRHPKTIITIFLFITALFCIFLPKLKINTSLRGLIAQKGEERDYCEKVKEVFGNNEMIFITFSGDNLFTSPILSKLKTLTGEIQNYEYIEDVKSIFTSRNVSSSENGISINPVFDVVPEYPAAIKKKIQLIIDNPLFLGNIISKDGKHLALIANIVSMPETKYTDLNVMEKTMSHIRQLIDDADLSLNVRYGGFPVMRVFSSRLTQRDFLVLAPIIFLIICSIIYISFRSVKLLLLAISIISLNMIWTLGFMAALGRQISVVTAMIPTLLLIVDSSYIIHMISIFYKNLKEDGNNTSQCEIVRRSTGYMITPLFFIALTTMAGFFSLSVSPLITINELGQFLAVGIFFVFLMAILFVPACLSLMKIEPKYANKQQSSSSIDSILMRINGLVMRKSIYIILVVIAFCVIALFKLPELKIQQDNLELFKENSSLRQDAYFINDTFDGANSFNLIVEANNKGAFVEPAILNKIDKIQEYMESKSIIDSSQSIVDVVKLLNKALHDQDKAFYTIPKTREAVTQYLLLNSNSSNTKDIERMITYDYDKISISFRFNTYDTDLWLKVQQDIELYAQKILSKDFTARVSGSLYLMALAFSKITESMISSVVLATIILTILLCILFRSISLGLITIIPNLTPIFISVGGLAWLGVQFDMISTTFGCIALGIAVDDTIHFTKSFFMEFNQSHNTDLALKNAFIKAGKPMLITTSAISIGFLLFMFSEFRLLMIFGLLCSAVMVLCLVVDLTLLPIILRIYANRKLKKMSVTKTEGNESIAEERGFLTEGKKPITVV